MNIHHWKQLIRFENSQNFTTSFPGDWYALQIIDENNFLNVILKPLNEDHFYLFEEQKGAILCFQRHLIEEDAKEYALDILNLFNLTPGNTINLSGEEKEKFSLSLSLLKKELDDSDNNYILIKTILKVVLLELIKFQRAGFINYELNQKRVYSFLNLMEQHYKTHQNATYYANRLNISEKRLNQILKEKLGKTAKQIIQQRLLTEIKRMLQTDELTVKEIAFQLHFQSLSNFTRFFKRHAGITPSDYKKQYPDIQ
ncbi:AraC-type DNA-binding protein [Pustulibacterium marinum]|uniref:AraC-type DNA-binding protein n=1 Tax=Pustulibacterium marinum TaxID=1224947 RepID=A0A1I7GVY6_9FLAO|nr:helix-turn-helix domain-containing protein [Pustulibacterium marinum]SFU52617.1 AraC-type DNA-binding protein [Pustulibacterium marinum]